MQIFYVFFTVRASVPNPIKKRLITICDIRIKICVFKRVRLKQKLGEMGRQRQKLDSVLYFQWRLHIPEIRPHDWRDLGGKESRSNHCWAKLSCWTDRGGGVQQSSRVFMQYLLRQRKRNAVEGEGVQENKRCRRWANLTYTLRSRDVRGGDSFTLFLDLSGNRKLQRKCAL